MMLYDCSIRVLHFKLTALIEYLTIPLQYFDLIVLCKDPCFMLIQLAKVIDCAHQSHVSSPFFLKYKNSLGYARLCVHAYVLTVRAPSQ